MTQRPAPVRSWQATGRAGLVLMIAAGAAVAAVAGVVSSARHGQASASPAPLTAFVRIESVTPNVREPHVREGGSRGVFRVDCGTNGNRKLSPDNPVAQPGVKHGAQHVHDFVGNLSISAESSDASLEASGTTCRNGDKSSYFWPVVRINRQAGTVGTSFERLRLAGPMTASCPKVSDRLPAVPAGARADVTHILRRLDGQVQEANRQLARSGWRGPDAVNAVLATLRTQRAASLGQIAAVLRHNGSRSRGLVSLADCDLSVGNAHSERPGLSGPSARSGYSAHSGHSANGPTAGPTSARPVAAGGGQPGGNAARTIVPTVNCPAVRDRLPGIPARALNEVNANLDLLDRQIAEANERIVTNQGQGGPDLIQNAILGPLRSKRVATLDRIAIAIGRSAQRPAGLETLAACTLNNASVDEGAPATGSRGAPTPTASAQLEAPQGPNLELAGNVGGIVQPIEVKIEYRGNTTSRVVAMPKFLKMITGDAKPTSRGPANARASWTCSGFTDRISDRYVICPQGSRVMRIHDFPGCWDGQNTDSANHRSHVAFADKRTGACPTGFRAIPQLRISISYDIPRDVQRKGQYQLDSFPEENHNPFSDHDDFANVNSARTMNRIVSCINDGRHCR